MSSILSSITEEYNQLDDDEITFYLSFSFIGKNTSFSSLKCISKEINLKDTFNISFNNKSFKCANFEFVEIMSLLMNDNLVNWFIESLLEIKLFVKFPNYITLNSSFNNYSNNIHIGSFILNLKSIIELPLNNNFISELITLRLYSSIDKSTIHDIKVHLNMALVSITNTSKSISLFNKNFKQCYNLMKERYCIDVMLDNVIDNDDNKDFIDNYIGFEYMTQYFFGLDWKVLSNLSIELIEKINLIFNNINTSFTTSRQTNNVKESYPKKHFITALSIFFNKNNIDDDIIEYIVKNIFSNYKHLAKNSLFDIYNNDFKEKGVSYHNTIQEEDFIYLLYQNIKMLSIKKRESYFLEKNKEEVMRKTYNDTVRNVTDLENSLKVIVNSARNVNLIDCNILHLTTNSSKDNPFSSIKSSLKPNPYFKIFLNEEELFSSDYVVKTCYPSWMQMVSFNLNDFLDKDNALFKINIYSKEITDSHKEDSFLGFANISFKEIIESVNENGEYTGEFSIFYNNKEYSMINNGKINISIRMCYSVRQRLLSKINKDKIEITESKQETKLVNNIHVPYSNTIKPEPIKENNNKFDQYMKSLISDDDTLFQSTADDIWKKLEEENNVSDILTNLY